MLNSNVMKIIDSFKVDNGTKELFKKMYTVYYHNIEFGLFKNTHFWTYSFTYTSLNFFERLKFWTEFNIKAFILGPIFYFVHGMLLKGVVLVAILYFLFAAGGFFSIFFPLVFLYCGFMGNKDYFLTSIKRNRKIMADTDILDGQCDELYLARILDTQGPSIVGPIVSLIIIISVLCFTGLSYISHLRDYNALKIETVCSSDLECDEYIEKLGFPLITPEKKYKAARALVNKKEYGNARKYLNDIIERKPDFTRAYLLRAHINFDSKLYQNAIDDYKSALEKNPKLYKINYNIGRCYYRMAQYTNAIAYLDKVIKKYPLEPEYREVRAYAYIGRRENMIAKRDLREAIKLYSLRLTSYSQKRKESLNNYYNSLK